MTLDELNGLPADAAERSLRQCCGSVRWAKKVAAQRPFASMDQLHRVADEAWWSLDGGDWLEAFAQHPRIGERVGGWSSEEQSSARGASVETQQQLARRNREYERRFGHVFLICATGRSAAEMLENREQRMNNDPVVELRVAAEEQAKITRLRLEKLLSPAVRARRA